jgi:hypothetical protein
MDVTAIIVHLFGLLAPAAAMAMCLPLTGRIGARSRPLVPSLGWQAALQLVACAGVLVGGLWFFGRDGMMATYLAMVVLSGSLQWLMVRGWRA